MEMSEIYFSAVRRNTHTLLISSTRYLLLVMKPQENMKTIIILEVIISNDRIDSTYGTYQSAGETKTSRDLIPMGTINEFLR